MTPLGSGKLANRGEFLRVAVNTLMNMREIMRLVEAFTVKGYHGTGDNIEQFRAKKLSGRGSHLLDIGIHFSENPKVASDYATLTDFPKYLKGMSAGAKPGGNPVVYPVMLDPGRVLDLTVIYAPDHDAPDHLKAAFASAYEHIASRQTVKHYVDMLDYDPIRALTHYQSKAGRRALRDLIVGLGYDSIRYDFGTDTSGAANNYVVFDPKRIRMLPEQDRQNAGEPR